MIKSTSVSMLCATATRLADGHSSGRLDGLARALEALELARGGNDRALLALAHRTLGHVLQSQQDYSGAIGSYADSLALYQAVGDLEGEFDVLGRLGHVALILGDYSEAIQQFDKALLIASSEQKSTVVLHNLAIVYSKLGNHERALSLETDVLERWRNAGDHLNVARTLNNLALEHVTQAKQFRDGAEPQKAQSSFMAAEKALKTAHETAFRLKDAELINTTFNNAARLQLERGEYQSAILAFRKQHERGKHINNPKLQVSAGLELARALRENGQVQEAISTFREALELSKALGLDDRLMLAHAGIAQSFEVMGDFQSALEHYKSFSILRMAALGIEAQRSAQAFSARLDLERAQRDAQAFRFRSERLESENSELSRQKSEFEMLALYDRLTAVPNRHHLEQHLTRAYDDASAKHHDLTVVMTDVDRFKSVNDTYGHGIGDDVLRQVAKILKHQLRNQDFLGRYGGEEFCLVLSRTSSEKAFEVCERLRRALVVFDWATIHPNLKVTASFGFCADRRLNIKEMLKSADARLYEAKNNGRNRVEPYHA